MFKLDIMGKKEDKKSNIEDEAPVVKKVVEKVVKKVVKEDKAPVVTEDKAPVVKKKVEAAPKIDVSKLSKNQLKQFRRTGTI